eukprot:Rmarinus@m.739
MGGNQNIAVAVRVRPINKRERNSGDGLILSVSNGKTIEIVNPSTQEDRQFTFDHSLDSSDHTSATFVSQEQVYQSIGRNLLEEGVWEGYNVSILAYGQTGSGKTYTMMGADGEHVGLIPRISNDVFKRVLENDNPDIQFRVDCSYLEIYNEQVKDLLIPVSNKPSALKIREHPKSGPYVEGLSNTQTANYTDIAALLDTGTRHRAVAATNMNEHSSRSHAIFTMTITVTTINRDTLNATDRTSKINLVDLAGSERAERTGATGERLKEAGAINKSLSTLGNVISSLADMSSKKKGKVHIPYRDSTLTWLLRESLGGNARTLIVAAVSPSSSNYEETMSTLRYADRAKRIVNHAVVNEDPNVRLIKELRAELEQLKEALRIAQTQRDEALRKLGTPDPCDSSKSLAPDASPKADALAESVGERRPSIVDRIRPGLQRVRIGSRRPSSASSYDKAASLSPSPSVSPGPSASSSPALPSPAPSYAKGGGCALGDSPGGIGNGPFPTTAVTRAHLQTADRPSSAPTPARGQAATVTQRILSEKELEELNRLNEQNTHFVAFNSGGRPAPRRPASPVRERARRLGHSLSVRLWGGAQASAGSQVAGASPPVGPVPSDAARAKQNQFGKCDIQGWLVKKGEGTIKRWGRRWVVLKDGVLFVFDKPDDSQPHGVIPLYQASAWLTQDRSVSKFTLPKELQGIEGNRIALSTPTGDHHMYAETKEAAEAWVLALSKASTESRERARSLGNVAVIGNATLSPIPHAPAQATVLEGSCLNGTDGATPTPATTLSHHSESEPHVAPLTL